MEELERRLRGRGTENEERIAARLRDRRPGSSTQREWFDHVVVNDDLERAADAGRCYHRGIPHRVTALQATGGLPDDRTQDRRPARRRRLQVLARDPGREARARDQLVLQPARRGPRRVRPAAGRDRGFSTSRSRSPSRRSPKGRSTTSDPRSPRSSSDPLAGRRVLLGVSGGIAAYKAASLARLLQAAGADVTRVLTEHATRFVGAGHVLRRSRASPRTPRSGNGPARSLHVRLAREADVAVVVARDRERARQARARARRRPAHRDAARGDVPVGARAGDALRDVGAPGDAGERRDAARSRRHVRRSGHRAARARRRRASAASRNPRTSSPRCERALAPHDLAGRRVVAHLRTDPRADRPGPLHREPVDREDGGRARGRGARPRRGRHGRARPRGIGAAGSGRRARSRPRRRCATPSSHGSTARMWS